MNEINVNNISVIPHELAVSIPSPLTSHPAAVYLSQLAPSSRRTMRQALNAIAQLLTAGQCDVMTLDWSKLRYQHTAALRSVFMEKYAPATANRMLCALRRVLKEARRLKLIDSEDYADSSDISTIRGSRLPRGRALTNEEISKLIEVCILDPTPAGLRDAAMIAILMAGLRRAEVVGMSLSDFNPITGALIVRRGKGNQDRITYLPPGAKESVEDWLVIRGSEPGALLCPVNSAGRITIRQMSDQVVMNMLIKRASEAGIERAAPHDLRRTFISDLLDSGADLLTVQKLAGHANPATTALYDRRGEEVKMKAVGKLKVPYRTRPKTDS
ncbi:integrase family protein (plasmid) [Crinalium epipsammum PCC 9333]|uniref:Integrase family protein n=1 Tax=Crinalium epipsammum PCC 9333 TaxID=1173022 RepID=K9W679_9CYAN|nr:tyrosine-type recombinase/integrase [Crinalium epipsammum]AFZ15681.1 integrase family protein [Crinalium epipsammum PCC 9333]